MMTNLLPKNSHKFACENCHYFTSNIKDFNKHLSTSKHKDKQKLMSNDDTISPKIPKVYSCECGKEYKHRQGLHVHKKTCKNNFQNNTQNTDFQFQFMLEIIKDNKEFKELLLEQNKQMLELAKQAGHNTTNNTNTNTNSHNKFNINLFLNEKCKDALNIQDFVSQLEVGISDLEETGRLGFADGISKIFINGLNQLEFYNRPIHCNDSKREVLYIKNDDKWTKEDSKPILTNAIKQVAHKNMKKISEWQKLNKDYYDPDSKQNDKYLKIVSESMSGSSKEESEKNYDKIIKKLVKETIIPSSEK
jgi:hypothetical protein